MKSIWSVSLVAAAIVAGGSRAGAQDDADLARSLAHRGWFDLAEEVCRSLKTSPTAKPEERSAVPVVLAEIKLAQAEHETDAAKVREFMDEAIKGFTDFVQQNPSHPMALDARIMVGWSLSRKAKMIIEAMEVEQEIAKQDELKTAAKETYEKAEAYFAETLKVLQGAKPQTDQIQSAIMDTRLELPRTHYEHAKLPQMGDEEKKKLLEKAILLLNDFEFDYGDRPIAFEASLVAGQCLIELGDFKKAETKIGNALALKQVLIDNGVQPNEYHKRVIFSSYIAMTQMYLKAGRATDARAFVDRVFLENKEIETEWIAFALKLEKAEALFAMRDMNGAMAILNDVMRADPNGRFGVMARAKVSKFSSGAGMGAVSADQMMTSADSYIEKDQYRDAMIALRRCIEACANDAEKSKYWPSAYFKLGQCLQTMRRNYEAAFAFEMLLRLYPKHELAAKACFEAARCYNTEFGVSGDKRDDEAKERFLSQLAANWPKDPAARNIPYLQAEKLENAGQMRAAAERYLTVTEEAEAYETALVRAGHCYRSEGFSKWAESKKNPALAQEAKQNLQQAKNVLEKFLARLKDPAKAPKDQEALKQRQNLEAVAYDQLARIYMHEAVGQAADGLKFLQDAAKGIPADDERLAKNWALQVQAYLTMGQLDPAVKLVESMFERFPYGLPIAQSCKSVAIRLDEQTTELIKKKGNEKTIKDNLRRVSKYYKKWLDEGIPRGMRVTVGDVVAVSEALYLIAKRLNGLDENVVSFLDLRGKALTERQPWTDAAFVHTILVQGKVGKLPDAERIAMRTRLARCFSFVATTQQGWLDAKDQYDELIQAFNLVGPGGKLNISAVQAHTQLLGVYLEYGFVLYELGRSGQRFQFDNAQTVFGNVLGVTQNGSEPWWLAKYMGILIMYERGKTADAKNAQIAINMLETSTDGNFDGGKYGLKEKFIDLRKKIDQVVR